MNKAHTNINWENYPSYNTPLNQQNLNKMDISIDLIDDRVITLDATKLDKSDAQTLVRSISLDRETGIFTITYFNGSFEIIDTLLEKIAVNFGYDAATQRLSITLDDGTVEYIDLSALITQYEFLDSETIAFQVQADGKIKAVIKKGSITEEYLRPDYLADIKVEVEKAKASEQSANQSKEKAENSAKLSESYARGGTGIREGEEADNAKEYARQAKESADAASSIITETFVLQSEKGIPGGIPTLDESGKIPQEQIPDIEGLVLGVKGESESEYRTGYINLTAEDIGALTPSGWISNNICNFISEDNKNPQSWLQVNNMVPGEKASGLFQKISAMFRNIRYLYKMLGSTDISSVGNGTVTGAIDLLNTDTSPTSQPYVCGFHIFRIGRMRIICSSNLVDADSIRNTILDYRDRPSIYTVVPAFVCTGGWGTIFGCVGLHTDGRMEVSASASVGGATGSYTDVAKVSFNAVYTV